MKSLFRKLILSLFCIGLSEPALAQNNPFNPTFAFAPSVQGATLYYNGSKWLGSAVGTAGQCWLSGGPGANPGWNTCPGGGGSGITSLSIAVPSFMGSTPSPLTTAGTITLSYNSQSGSYFLASPTGSSGAPTFRPLVAADITTVPTGVLKGSSGSLVAATAGTDYVTPTGSIAANTGVPPGMLKASVSGTLASAVAGTDYVTPSGVSSIYMPLAGGSFTGNVLNASAGGFYQNSFTCTGTATSGSNSVTLTGSCTALKVNMLVNASFAVNNPVLTVTGGANPTSFTMLNNASANATNVSITFGVNRWNTSASIITGTLGADNLYLGAAASGGNDTWLNSFVPGVGEFPAITTGVFLSKTGTSALIVGSRTSDNSASYAQSIPYQCFQLVDTNAALANSWCEYVQTNLLAGSAPSGAQTYGHLQREMTINSLWTAATVLPYNATSLNKAHVTNLRLDAGGNAGSGWLPITSYLELVLNNATADTGMIVGAGALTSATGDWLKVACGYQQAWYNTTTRSASIQGDCSGNMNFSVGQTFNFVSTLMTHQLATASTYGTNFGFYSGSGDIHGVLGTSSGGYVQMGAASNHGVQLLANNVVKFQLQTNGYMLASSLPTTAPSGVDQGALCIDTAGYFFISTSKTCP